MMMLSSKFSKDEITYNDILRPEHQSKIKTYKYEGADHSIAYQYCLSPFAQWLVDNKLPPNIA
jgi:hypothetical protein